MTLGKVASGCSVVKDHAICTRCGRLGTVRVCAANLRISSSGVEGAMFCLQACRMCFASLVLEEK